MGNFVLQTKTFYCHFEDFMPVLIAVYLFLIMQITHWHIYFSVTRLLTLILLRAKDGAIFHAPHAPYHTPVRLDVKLH